MPIIVGTYSDISPERALAIEAATEAELQRRAVSSRATRSADETVIRDLLPTDLNDANDDFNAYLSTGYGLLYSGTLTDKKVLGIFAVAQWHVPGSVENQQVYVGAVKFKLGAAGATVKDIWNIQGKGLEQGKQVWAKAPIIYDKMEMFNLEGIATGSGRAIIFLGKVAEPKGELISPE